MRPFNQLTVCTQVQAINATSTVSGTLIKSQSGLSSQAEVHDREVNTSSRFPLGRFFARMSPEKCKLLTHTFEVGNGGDGPTPLLAMSSPLDGQRIKVK